MSVTAQQRHTRAHRCPVCGGADGDPRGKGKRCTGFTSADREYVHCSREEHAGSLNVEGAGTYAHRMRGPCKCGSTHGESVERRAEIAAEYNYTDESGTLLFQVVRFLPKDFRQRRPDGNGGWEWRLGETRRVLYRLPELVDDDADRTVYICEGEKDVGALAKRGFLATCNPMGAGKWSQVAEHARTVLAGRDIVIIADNDEPGEKHAREVAESLRDVVRSIRVVVSPKCKDVSDHLIEGGTVESLVELPANDDATPIDAAPVWEAAVVSVTPQWFEDVPPPRKWLLRDARRPKSDGLLPLGKVGQFIGAGGVSKTMALIQLAIAEATGGTWLGAFDTVAAGRVLVVVGEEDAEEAHRRMYRARRATNAPTPPTGTIVVLPLAGVPCAMLERDDAGNLRDAAFLTWMREWLTTNGPFALIIFDPLSRFAGPDAEIDNAAATRFIQALESIATLTGATVLVAHHTAKFARRGGAVDAVAGRGSSALVDGARWQASLGIERLEIDDADARERLGEIVVWTHTKSNYSRTAATLLLRRDADNGGALVPLDDLDRELVEAARGRDSTREQKQRGRDAVSSAKADAEDRAVVQAVNQQPGISTRDLASRVQAICGAGRERAMVAIARVATTLDVREGARSARLHYPRSVPSTVSATASEAT
jgi:RecA-family ATPase/5S rRNA maturation endonuclease (ribonuclease M5)